MKKILLFLVFSFQIGFGFSQSTAVEIEYYCLGNEMESFVKTITPTAKTFFENFLKQNQVDTSKIYKVKFDEVFLKYTTESYLKSHNYKFVYWFKEGSSNQYKTYEGINLPDAVFDKLIVVYTTDRKQHESLWMYLIN